MFCFFENSAKKLEIMLDWPLVQIRLEDFEQECKNKMKS